MSSSNNNTVDHQQIKKTGLPEHVKNGIQVKQLKIKGIMGGNKEVDQKKSRKKDERFASARESWKPTVAKYKDLAETQVVQYDEEFVELTSEDREKQEDLKNLIVSRGVCLQKTMCKH